MTVMIGIDPHKTSHAAVAIDGDERVLDEVKTRSSTGQADRLRVWADKFDDERQWAVESARRATHRVEAPDRCCGRGVGHVTD